MLIKYHVDDVEAIVKTYTYTYKKEVKLFAENF